jgi:thymidylate synthase
MSFKSIVKELLFFLSGQTDTKILEAQGVNIWKHNTSRQFLDAKGLQHYKEGDMGHSYGFSFRHFGATYTDAAGDYKGQGFDQINYIINEIKSNPTSRRLLISLWEPNNMHKAPLPPCLYGYQFFINPAEKTISCIMTQRSSDVAVAAGWNLATGALLTYMIGHITGYEPDRLIWNVGDMHVYANHVEAIKKQIERQPRPFPLLYIKNKRKTIEEFTPGDFVLLAYNPHEKIEFQLN